MASLAATFRLLYSSDASLDSKLEAAEQLVVLLLDGSQAAVGGAASDVAALPPLVRTHYLRSLLEWSCGILTKKGGAVAAAGDGSGAVKKGKKRKQQQEEQADELGPAPAHTPPPVARLQPRCWTVLVAVLGSGSTAASQQLPATLLPAATAVLQMLRKGGQQEQREDLLVQLAALFQLLHGKFRSSFRPGIEHAAATAEAALAGHAAAAGQGQMQQQAWNLLAAAAVRLLLEATGGHPNQRKVWDATVPRLLPLLAQAAFPASNSSSDSSSKLPACCLDLLGALLFHQQHVAALAAAAATEMANAVVEAGAGAAAGAAAAGDASELGKHTAEDASSSQQQQWGSSYAVQLFTVVQEQVSGGQLPLALLPWMVSQFCVALRQHWRAAETEAAITSQAGLRSQQQRQNAGEESAAEEGQNSQPSRQPVTAPGGSGISVSADFHFWLALLRTLLPHVEQLQKEQPEAAPGQLAIATSGVALLAAALRRHQLYRPTQDPAGCQHLLLQRLADAVLLLAQQQLSGGAARGTSVVPAVLGVLGGILAVEHRVIQQQLPELWPLLLWSPATTTEPGLGDSSSSGDGAEVAVEVACSLVAVFAELRQLEVLLQSLTAALQQQPKGAAPQEQEAAMAAALLRSNQFQAMLVAAVRQLPSGQVPMVLRLAVTVVPHLAVVGSGSTDSGRLLAVDVYSYCLGGLHIDLTTAMAAAAAAQALVAALAPPLLPLLLAAASGKKKEERQLKEHEELLPALLRLYHRTLVVHARCAALHPEVVPLVGQHMQLQLGDAAHSLPAGRGGYFAPLVQSAGTATASAPQLTDLLQAGSSGSSLHRSILQAAHQQLLVLQRQWQYLVHSCPVTLLPGAEQLEEAQEEERAQAQVQQQRRRQQQRMAEEQEWMEGELRQLASFVVAAAAVEATGGSHSGSACAALEVAAQALPLLQEWAAEVPLLALLQACLHEAAGPVPVRQQQLCRQLLLGGELLEQRRLVVLLPTAAAAQLGSTLSAVFGGSAADDGQQGLKQKKRKKVQPGSVAAPGAENASANGHLAALLEQLGRVAAGKAAKAKAWASAVESSCSSIAGLAESSGGSGSKKRKSKAATEGGSRPGATDSSGLQRLQRQMLLLAQLPLGLLPEGAAAGMAVVAVGSLLYCCEGSLGLLQAAGTLDQQQLAGSALPAATGCLALLAALADCVGGGSGGGVTSQQQLLPGVLQAALVAAGSMAAVPAAGKEEMQLLQVQKAAEHSGGVMQAVCSALLAAGDGSGLQNQMMQQLSRQLTSQALQPQQQWAAAVLAQACLAACYASACGGSSVGRGRAAADILSCQSSSQPKLGAAATELVGSTAAKLDATVAAALLPAAAAAACGSRQPILLAASLYHSAALLLRLRCCDHPVADVVEQQQDGSTSCVSTLAGGLHTAAALLVQMPAGGHEQQQGPLAPALLQYVSAACCLTGHMRPAASSSHYASLLALLLHLLAAQQPAGAAEAGGIQPGRHTIPFTAAFPAGAAAAPADRNGRSSRSGTELHSQLLEALRELLAGSSSQQLLLPLRFVEAALSAGGGSGMALPLCELLLAVLEAGSGGNRQQRLLGQHSERIMALLNGFISGTAYDTSLLFEGKQQQQQQVPSLAQLAGAILAAGEGGGGGIAACTAAAPRMPSGRTSATVAAAPPAAEVAALCTALRAFESLAARPKLFPWAPAAASSMLSSITAVWTAYAEQPGQQQGQQELGFGSAAVAAMPGFRFRLGTSGGAALFSASCHLLLAMLRHRQQEMKRCVPLVLQAVHSLLRFLAAAELSAKLQKQVLRLLSEPAWGRQSEAHAQRERGWRVKCAELLAAVVADLAGLKEAGIGRYCPQLLADYLVLAAAPPSAKSQALLHFSSPTRAAAAVALQNGSSSGNAVAAAAAEEDVLAGEPLSSEAAAALRQGAFALYGACSAKEIQFLYASLGSAAGGGASGQRGGAGAGASVSWRAALAALKAEYERSGRYTGKV